jgi:hypothetical protein
MSINTHERTIKKPSLWIMTLICNLTYFHLFSSLQSVKNGLFRGEEKLKSIQVLRWPWKWCENVLDLQENASWGTYLGQRHANPGPTS